MGRQFPALRGIAILLVVLNHTITLSLLAVRTYGHSPAPVWQRYLLVGFKELGLLAVPTFLFLSGCFVVYAVRGKALKAAYKTVWSGLKHVLSAYVVWSVVFYVMVYFLKAETYTPLEYLKHLLVGYPFNFVPLLVMFYLLAPLLVWMGARSPWAVVLAVGAYQLFLVNVLKPGTLGFAFPTWAGYLTPPGLRVTLALWGIYFPLGVIYSLHADRLLPTLTRWWWVLAVGALATFGLAVLTELSMVNVTLAGLLCPVLVVLLFPLIRRDALPWVVTLEQLGKKSFGLYLTNLLVLNLMLAAIQALAPGLFGALLLLAPLLFVFTVVVPWSVMTALERWPTPAAHRYVFG